MAARRYWVSVHLANPPGMTTSDVEIAIARTAREHNFEPRRRRDGRKQAEGRSEDAPSHA